MDNSLPNTSNPSQPLSEAIQNGPEIAAEQNQSINVGGPDSATPTKRRPGRPKGSGKKSLDVPAPVVPKIKRPVGRPRKDGFPAGSVGPRRSARPRKSAPAKLGLEMGIPNPVQTTPSAVHFNGQVYYSYPPGSHPQWQGGISSASASGPPIAIDPNLDRDDWADIVRTKPTTFLATLLSALYAPNPMSSAGPSVEEAFKSHLVSLAPKSDQIKGSQPIPSLYSILKTFWLPSSPAYFSLTASASTPRTPSEHRFLYWDPQPLVFNGIACPSCSVALINKGRIRSGPIKVYDLENPFFIIGCEYVCKSATCVANTSAEGRKFASTDWAILRSLPARLKDEFPAHLMQGDPYTGSGANVWNWQALGVSRSLWNMVRGCLQVGLGKAAIFQLMQAIQGRVLDDHEKMEEEEGDDNDDGDDEMQEEAVQHDGNDDARMHNPAIAEQQDNVTEEYNNAWKANSAVSNPTATPSAGPSGAAVTITPNAVPGPSSQPFGLPQGAPYPTLPYGYYTYFQQPPAGQPSGSNTQNTPGNAPDPNHNTLKRPYTFAGDGTGTSDAATLEPSQKRTRHCCKCGSQECKGKGGRSFCMNVCQDCGKLDCKGRNSRRPDKRCAEAWS